MTAFGRAILILGVFWLGAVSAGIAVARDGSMPPNVLSVVSKAGYAANKAEADPLMNPFKRRAAATQFRASVITALVEYPQHVREILQTANVVAPLHRSFLAKYVGQVFPGYRRLAFKEANASESAVLSEEHKQSTATPRQSLWETFGLTAFVIGAGGHDAGVFGRNKEAGEDINVEFRFAPFGGWLWEFLQYPEPHIGGHLNTEKNTNQVFFGGTWMFDIGGGFFAGGGLSLAVHDGKTDTDLLDRKELGLPVLFRESAELGYRFGQHHGISFHLDHISNASIAKNNEGLDTFGLRYTYRI